MICNSVRLHKTARGYEWALGHACPALGAKPIATVSRSDVEQLISAVPTPDRAQSSATLVLFVVRSVFDDAIEDGLVGRNPGQECPPGRPHADRTGGAGHHGHPHA